MSSDPNFELHLICQRGDTRAWSACRSRADAGSQVRVVLIHDAVLETEASLAAVMAGGDHPRVLVMACAADALRRRVAERWALVDYPEIIRSCAAAERVISW